MYILEQIGYIFKDGIELGLIWALLALGVFISFRILDFADLTAEGTITLGASIAAITIINVDSVVLALVLAIIGGFLAGIITGLLHTKLKIPPILSGIIMLTALYSINKLVLQKASVTLTRNKTIYSFFDSIFSNAFISYSLTSVIILILVIVGVYFLFGTEVGIGLRATGMNEKMAKVQGINTDRMIVFGLALSNAIIALCGALIAQSDGHATLDLGRGTIVIGLASIIIGEILFGKRTFKNWLISVVAGSIIFQVLVASAIALGLNPDIFKLMQAILIAIILGMPVIKEKLKRNGRDKNVEINKYHENV